MLHQAKRRAAHAFFKARLHHPNFAHVGGQFATPGHVADAGVKHIVYRVLQGRMRMLPLRLARSPTVAHIGPEHAGQQKARRHRFALAHTPVGILQCGGDKRMVGALHHQIEQRVNTALQPELAQLRDRGQCMPGLQELEHFIEQTTLRYIGQQGQAFAQRGCSFAVHLKAQRR